MTTFTFLFGVAAGGAAVWFGKDYMIAAYDKVRGWF